MNAGRCVMCSTKIPTKTQRIKKEKKNYRSQTRGFWRKEDRLGRWYNRRVTLFGGLVSSRTCFLLETAYIYAFLLGLFWDLWMKGKTEGVAVRGSLFPFVFRSKIESKKEIIKIKKARQCANNPTHTLPLRRIR
jgi:hypothetical protein